MAIPTDTRHFAHAEDSSSVNEQWPNLKEYTKAHSASSNDCKWLHEFVSSDAISTKKINPEYLLRVQYKMTKDASTTFTEDLRTDSAALSALKDRLASKNVRAVILCHRDSSQVDPVVLDLLWTSLQLEVSFMRHHFDYMEFRDEPGCPGVIRNLLEQEDETRDSVLRLSVDSECLSVCCRGGIVIALIRSKAVYQQPLSPWRRHAGHVGYSDPCVNDLFAATAHAFSMNHKLSSDSSELSSSIVHFYARLLVLRCYEDYNLRHDTQLTELDDSNQVASQGHPEIIAMHHRRLELVKMKQNLFGYLGPLAPEHKSGTGANSTDDPYRRKLQSLLTDIEMLLALYDNTMRIYEWHIHETDSNYKAELASEQLAEAKESKTTAISLGKLSNLAFLYLPINFVCAMLGMNLSIFGQGTVPVWVFLILVLLFGLPTYLPIYVFPVDERRVRYSRLTYHLARRSISAGFWFLVFSLTHNHHQNFEIINSGLAQIFLGSTTRRTKGWLNERHDNLFERSTWGSEVFWRNKVKKIYLAVEELNSDNGATELTV